MITLLVHAGRDGPRWKALFQAAAPELHVVAWPEAVDPAMVDYFACWRPPAGLLGALPNLKAVFALGAGVDGLLARSDLPAGLALIRLTDAGMVEQMVEYALYGVLDCQRRMRSYAAQQARSEWRQLPAPRRAELRVGVLGLGVIGAAIATTLAGLGYPVRGWSRSAKALPGVQCSIAEPGLTQLLKHCDVLINALPSTPATRGLLDRHRLSLLPQNAYVVHCSRGDQLDADALVELLDRDRLSGALLDVFAAEPLPVDSPLWRHPKILLTPHVAALTVPEASTAQIVDKLRRLEAGGEVEGQVDRSRAY